MDFNRRLGARFYLGVFLVFLLIIVGCRVEGGDVKEEANYQEEILSLERLSGLLSSKSEEEQDKIILAQQRLVGEVDQEKIEDIIKDSLEQWLEDEKDSVIEDYSLSFTRDDLLMDYRGYRVFNNLILDLSLAYDWEKLGDLDEQEISRDIFSQVPFALISTTEVNFLLAEIDLKLTSLGGIARYSNKIGLPRKKDLRQDLEEEDFQSIAVDFVDEFNEEVKALYLEAIPAGHRDRYRSLTLTRFGIEGDRLLAEITVYDPLTSENLVEDLEARGLELKEELISRGGDYLDKESVEGFDLVFRVPWNPEKTDFTFDFDL